MFTFGTARPARPCDPISLCHICRRPIKHGDLVWLEGGEVAHEYCVTRRDESDEND